jgi:hypothetical protein
MSEEKTRMGAYFQTLAQAESHVQDKKNVGRSKIEWCIVDCHIGFLVVSEAQARHCFPDLFYDAQASLTKTEYTS